jgi:hypothetical protein
VEPERKIGSKMARDQSHSRRWGANGGAENSGNTIPRKSDDQNIPNMSKKE